MTKGRPLTPALAHDQEREPGSRESSGPCATMTARAALPRETTPAARTV